MDDKKLTDIKLTDKQKAIIDLKTKNPNATGTEIAKLAGADISYTLDVLKRYGLTKQNIEDYNKNKSDIWAGITSRILSSLSPEDIQKASLQQKITAAGIAFDKQQILTGGAREVTPMIIVNRVSIDSKSVDNPDIITVDNSDVINSIT